MTSIDHFQSKISFVYKLKTFWMIHHNDNFIFKSLRLFVGSGFLVSHREVRKPIHFYGLSPLGTMSDHNWRVFHSRGDLSLLADIQHIFSLPFIQPCDSVGRYPIYRAHQIKHQMQCLTNHALTPIECDVLVHLQCNMPLHVISCHMHNEYYKDNTFHITYRCHGQSHHLHMTSIHHFIQVNISYKDISTFTFNMSFYDQAMTHTQASHVMALAHNNSSHVNILESTH